jgi:hypothetical protein
MARGDFSAITTEPSTATRCSPSSEISSTN